VRSVFALELDDVALALLGQRLENHFVGAQVGVMDPMACCLGEEGAALFIDTRSLEFRRVTLPAGADLVVINSGVAHDHAAGDYNSRREECERACRLLGISHLRDLGPSDLPRLEILPELLRCRARHVITENQRVLDSLEALRASDLNRLGQLFFASHTSQRDDYEVSVPATDRLVELAHEDSAVYGARLTGGGFGGSVVMVVRAGAGAAVARRITDRHGRQSEWKPSILVPALATS
jgi:galactokinase